MFSLFIFQPKGARSSASDTISHFSWYQWSSEGSRVSLDIQWGWNQSCERSSDRSSGVLSRGGRYETLAIRKGIIGASKDHNRGICNRFVRKPVRSCIIFDEKDVLSTNHLKLYIFPLLISSHSQNVFNCSVPRGNRILSKKDHRGFVFLQETSFRNLACTCVEMAHRSLRVCWSKPSCFNGIRPETIYRRWIEECRCSFRARPIRLSFKSFARKEERTKSFPADPSLYKNSYQKVKDWFSLSLLCFVIGLLCSLTLLSCFHS